MNGYKILKCFRKEKRISGELPCQATGLIYTFVYCKISLFKCRIIAALFLRVTELFKFCSIKISSISLQNALKERDYESAEELQAVINKLTISIQRLKAKLQGTEPPLEETEVRTTGRHQQVKHQYTETKG